MRGFHITDHATLRYIERVYGLDVDRIRKEMEKEVKSAASAGAASFRTTEGHTYKMDRGVVITVYGKGMK